MTRRGTGGQAMSEFLVCALFVLVPLFLAITALGKLSDVQRTADMAARYAAWERTVWYPDSDDDFEPINEPNHKGGDAILRELTVRVLNNHSQDGSTILATDQDAAGFANGTDPMWKDHAGVAFLEDYDQVTAGVERATPTNDVTGTVLNTLQSVSVNGAQSFVPPLPTNTLAVAEVTLNDVGRNSQAYQRLWSGPPAWDGLRFSSTGAILSNTWSANGSGSTKGMVAKMVPTAQAAGAFVTAAKVGLAPWDPMNAPRIDVGKIAVDVVPEDRLR